MSSDKTYAFVGPSAALLSEDTSVVMVLVIVEGYEAIPDDTPMMSRDTVVVVAHHDGPEYVRFAEEHAPNSVILTMKGKDPYKGQAHTIVASNQMGGELAKQILAKASGG